MVTRTEPRVGLAGPGDREIVRLADDTSVGELVQRLAEEGKELATVELRRLRVEIEGKARDVGERARLGVGVLVVGTMAVTLSLLMGLAMTVGIFLALGRVFDDYTLSAFATGGILAIGVLIAALSARGLFGRMVGERDQGKRE